MKGSFSSIANFTPEIIATATLVVGSNGQSFTEITGEAARFVTESGAKDGALFLFMRHTSASLVIQENADPDVRSDLASALDRLAPADARWIHDVEGPDDMPAHVKTMLTGVSLHVPVIDGASRLARGKASTCRAPCPAAPARSRAAIHRKQAAIGWSGFARNDQPGRQCVNADLELVL